MPALSEYANVHDTAVELLQRADFQVWFNERPICSAPSGMDGTSWRNLPLACWVS